MNEYETNEVYVISGRGKVWVIDMSKYVGKTISLGEKIKINGIVGKVVGIEKATFSKNIGVIINEKEK